MKNLLILLMFIILTSCEKEETIIQTELFEIEMSFQHSSYGELKADVMEYKLTTSGDILDTINNSINVKIKELDKVVIDSEYDYENYNDIKVKLTKSNGELYEYKMDGYLYLIYHKDSFIIIN